MPVENINVSLSEALEVRGGPLEENEIWGLLSQSVVELQELLITGEIGIKHC